MTRQGIKWVSISLTENEKNFLDNNQISPTKLFKWAISQRGFKKTKK